MQTLAGGNGNALEELRREIVQGFLYSHTRANDNTGKALEIASFCYALIELLNERGIISIEELDERKKVVGRRLVRKFAEKGIGAVDLQKPEQDGCAFGKGRRGIRISMGGCQDGISFLECSNADKGGLKCRLDYVSQRLTWKTWMISQMRGRHWMSALH